MMCTAAVTAYWDSWRERRHHGCYSYFFFSCCIHVILSRAELQASRSRFGWNVHVILQDLIPSLRHRTFLTATYLQLGAKKYRSTNRSLVNGCSIKKPSITRNLYYFTVFGSTVLRALLERSITPVLFLKQVNVCDQPHCYVNTLVCQSW